MQTTDPASPSMLTRALRRQGGRSRLLQAVVHYPNRVSRVDTIREEPEPGRLLALDADHRWIVKDVRRRDRVDETEFEVWVV